jgi:hypothetical protein
MSDQQAETAAVGEFVQSTTTFTIDLDVGGRLEPVVVHRGEYVRADHPIVSQNPQYFEPVSIESRWDTVEQATAAPGERRTVGRRHRPVGRTGVPRDPRGFTEPD